MIRWRVFDQMPINPTQIISAKVKKTKVVTMEITIEKANMSGMVTTTATTITTETTMATEKIALDLMFILKTENLHLGRLDVT